MQAYIHKVSRILQFRFDIPDSSAQTFGKQLQLQSNATGFVMLNLLDLSYEKDSDNNLRCTPGSNGDIILLWIAKCQSFHQLQFNLFDTHNVVRFDV